MSANSTETTQDNTTKIVRDMEHQDPQESRTPKPSRKIDHQSDWSGSEYGKDHQSRAKPVDIQDPQTSTSYANKSAPLRHPKTLIQKS